MTTLNLIIWIFVYSICLFHIAVFAIIYSKHKNKIELLYLIVLLNVFLLTIIIMASLILKISMVIPMIVNGTLSLNVSLPIFGYNLYGINKKFFILIPVLVIIQAVIENILLLHNNYNFLYLSKILFNIILLVPVFINANKYQKGSLEWVMQDVSKKTVIIIILYMIVFIPFSINLFQVSYTPSLWWAAFTLSYQIPGFVYCYKYLRKKYALSLPPEEKSKEILSLTKRENEVAQAICSGLKYEEIAKKLFVSLSAVKKHSYSIYKKLGINNNRELMHIFMDTQKTPKTSNRNLQNS